MTWRHNWGLVVKILKGPQSTTILLSDISLELSMTAKIARFGVPIWKHSVWFNATVPLLKFQFQGRRTCSDLGSRLRNFWNLIALDQKKSAFHSLIRASFMKILIACRYMCYYTGYIQFKMPRLSGWRGCNTVQNIEAISDSVKSEQVVCIQYFLSTYFLFNGFFLEISAERQ